MIRGLYTAWTGMVNQQNRLDTITNNLANSATTGYKREGATSQSFDNVLAVKVKDSSEYNINRPIGTMSLGVKIGENYTDYSQGAFRQTENAYDLAIEGEGFFSIAFTSKEGIQSVKYTRDGEFTTDANGVLRTKDGNYVLGQNGRITIPTQATTVSVDALGNITADGVFVDRLAIVDFEDYNYLEKYGENMLNALDGATMQAAQTNIHQGYLEASNVNVIKEMVEMITITRAYETNQKVIQSIDDALDKSANTIGKVY